MGPILSLVAPPIALLLTLRTNQALGRLQEARTAWGRTVFHARVLASMLDAYIKPLHPSAAMLAARHLALFGWSMKARVRGEDDLDVVNIMLPREEAEWVTQPGAKTPVALLARVRDIVASVATTSREAGQGVPVAAHQAIETNLADLEACFGVCERISGSPVPPTYTRHTSRVLVSWLVLLPLGLDSSGLSRLTNALATLLASYVLIGVDEIGVE